MTANEVLGIIRTELSASPLERNLHGLSEADVLAEPYEEEYASFDGSYRFIYWTVVEECPDKSGYTIYFDPDTGQFGLGTRTDEGVVDIGTYGSFKDAFRGM